MLRAATASVLAGSLALVSGCGGGGGSSSSQQAGAVVFLDDASAAPVVEPDGDPVMSMTELTVSVQGVRLVAQDGRRHGIAVGGAPAHVARLSGAASSGILATGAFTPGVFTGVEIVLADATVRGVPAAGGAAADRALEIPASRVVVAAFAAPVTLTAGAHVSVAWPAAVSSNDGGTVLTLGTAAQAFLVGGAGASGKASLAVHRVKGDLTSLDGAADELRLVVGLSTLTVATTPATKFLDQDATPVQDGLAGLDVGDELSVEGALQAGGRLDATLVRVAHRARAGHVAQGHHGSAHFEFEGVARDVVASGATGATLRLFAGKVEVARVLCDVSAATLNHGTIFQRENGTALSLAQLLAECGGRRVQVTASLVVQNPGGVPEARATDLVIVEP